MQRRYHASGATLFLLVLLAGILQARKYNVILMIADGWGYNQILATDYWNGSKAGYEEWETAYAMSTFNYGENYDGVEAWSNLDYVKLRFTDSAAAATTMSTGVKTNNRYIGLDHECKPVEHIIECAESIGLATGVVTNVEISHATPAGFVAHNRDRGNYTEIAQEMIEKSAVDVIMGAGNPIYDNNGELKTSGFEYKYVGGEELWNALMTGTAGGDADGDGAADPWTLIENMEEFQKLGSGITPGRVIGVARVKETLQEKRSGADKHDLPYADPFIKGIPTLAEMTRGTLNVLDNDPDGFFLMIEGGAIDWANHDNLLGRMIEEMDDFNRAFDVVVHWVQSRSSWNETLVIVTGDHETGFLTGPDSGVPGSFSPLVDNGPGQLPGYQYRSGDHTNSLIPFYAKGRGSDRFITQVVAEDPVRGEYIDNTAIARVVFELLREWQPVSRSGQVVVPESSGALQGGSESMKRTDTKPGSGTPPIGK
jgi:alkaline phosphatase